MAEEQAVAGAPANDVDHALEEELHALIAELNPPSLDQLLEWLAPIPDVESVLAPLPNEGVYYVPPEPPLEDQRTAEELANQIEACNSDGSFGDSIPLAEQLLAIRVRDYGADHWRSVDALDTVLFVERAAEMPAQIQADLLKISDLERRGYNLYENRRSAEAARSYIRSLHMREACLGREDVAYTDTLDSIASFATQAGRWREAEQIHAAALEIRIRSLGIYNVHTVALLNSFAYSCRSNKHLAMATACAAKAVAVRRELCGDGDFGLESSLFVLGKALYDKGDYWAAEQALRSVLDRRVARFGPDHIAIVGTLTSLGSTVLRQGRLVEAERLFRRAVEVSERRPDESSEARFKLTPGLAGSYNNLALALQLQGQYARAEDMYRRAVYVERVLLGDQHPSVAGVLKNLAAVLQHAGNRTAAAESLYREALVSTRALLGDDHPDVADILHALSSVLLENGEYQEAQRACEEALRIRRAVLGDEHESVAESRFRLARIMYAQGDVDRARTLAREALAACERLPLTDPSLRINIAVQLGTWLSETRSESDLAAAESLLLSAVNLADERHYRDAHVAYTAYANFLAEHRQDAARAVALYRKAIEQIECARARAPSDVLDQAQYFTALQRADAYGGLARIQMAMASTPPASSSPDDASPLLAALTTLESGHGRATLELLERSGVDEYALAAGLTDRTNSNDLRASINALWEREGAARARRLSAEAQVKSTLEDRSLTPAQRQQQISQLEEQRDLAAEAEEQAIREAADRVRSYGELRALAPLRGAAIAKLLKTKELLLAYDVGEHDSRALLVDCTGRVRVARLKWPDGNNTSRSALTTAIADAWATVSAQGHERPSGTPGPYDARDIESALIPSEWRAELAGASRVLIVPDEALYRWPFALQAISTDERERWIDAWPPIVYGPSATVMVTERKWALERKAGRDSNRPSTGLVAVGDPDFGENAADAEKKSVIPEPDYGVLVASVNPRGNHAGSGLQSGDVLLRYNGVPLKGPVDLAPAIEQAERLHRQDAKPNDAAAGGGSDTSRGRGDQVPVTVWRGGRTLELALAPVQTGMQVSQCPMPTALDDWRGLLLDEGERVVEYASVTTRSGFRDVLTPLPGTRAEVAAIAEVMERAGVKDDAINVLTGDNATLTNLFEITHSPRLLHFATHGRVYGGRRVRESALALTVPEQPTADDFGFLRLQDLLDKWGGRLDGTELVVLSGCDTATGRLEAADGFVGLTWGFLYAGAESVVASLWKVDDAATVLLMHRLYENLLGVYDEPRMGFEPGAEMPKAEALHEAKRWLRHQTPEQNRKMLRELGMDTEELVDRYRSERSRLPSEDPQTLAGPFDYSAPRYWAAFILIGSPD